ncbi:MAG: PulJ/GspJ family protein [Candidatus Hydrogenedentales bacterium]|jgi:prepilin-type N-terminal cleavage/methylation domain-containing protein
MMAIQQVRSSKQRETVRGFTLPELLVSMSIMGILSLALFMLFSSTLSAFKSTKRSMEASDETHTAFRVMERDLAQAYSAKHYGDSANFFGCPYGFSMIATLDAAGQARTARISYVVHRFAGRKAVDSMLDNGDDALLPTFGIVRYVEPGVDKLSAYPVEWPDYTSATLPIEEPQQHLYQPLREIYEQFGPGLTSDPTPVSAAQLEAMLQAKKHELWLAMLGDRDELYGELPRLWDDPDAPGTTWSGGPLYAGLWDGKYPEDYLIAEGVVQANPELQFSGDYTITPDPNGMDVVEVQNFNDVHWFRYGYTPREVDLIDDMGRVQMTPYWNAVDEANIGIGPDPVMGDPGEINFPFINLAGSPLYPFPPSLVGVDMAFAFPAPNLGERHFVRKLAHTFQVPVGYRRPTLRQP